MSSLAMDDFWNLPWLKDYNVDGCPDNVIKVQFRRPPFISEEVLVRIDALENRTFHCTVVVQPKKDWRINKGDHVLVEYFFFENAHLLVCRTIERKFCFEWLL